MAEELLKLVDISKSFPGVRALKKVSFSVNRGEVMGLMGENGAGKSTLIKIITGYYKRDAGSGEMYMDGVPVNPNNTMEAQKIGISTIFQELNLSPYMSIAENIFLGNAPRKNGLIDWKTMRQKAREAMLDLGLDVDVDSPIETQSTAIQQMTAIARALELNAKILIMDEATSSLEAKEVKILFDVVHKLKSRGISTIFITHKLDEVFQICDRVTILKDGEYVATKSMEGLTKLELISLMIGRDASSIVNKKKIHDPKKQEAPVFFSARDIRKNNFRLNGIDIDIHKGEVVGLAGLLGSGRTELAKVIFGDDVYYEGEMFLNNTAVRFKSPYDAKKHRLAYCTEDRRAEGIFPNMSVMDNLTMTILGDICRGGILNRKKQREITAEYIKAIAIKTPNMNAKIKNLSGGNMQKVILSRWLATKPDLIILDEPTRGIDVGAKSEIENLIKKISDEGITVLYISSELDELVRECDRIVVLSEGRKVGEIVGDDISNESIMAAIASTSNEN